MNGRRILLAVSGGIAAYKVPELVRALRPRRLCGALRPHRGRDPLRRRRSCSRPSRASPCAPSSSTPARRARSATSTSRTGPRRWWWRRPRRTCSRSMAAGLADDLVTTLLLATRAPVLVAPGDEREHVGAPGDPANVATLAARGVHFVGPDAGALACGWEGAGRMAEPAEIAGARSQLLLGPREPRRRARAGDGGRDARARSTRVRALVNRSSGKMGFALAAEAARRGAEVVLVAGPSALPTPAGVRRVDVETRARDARRRPRRARRGERGRDGGGGRGLPARRAGQREDQEGGSRRGRGPRARARREPGHPRRDQPASAGARIVVGFAAESDDVIASRAAQARAEGLRSARGERRLAERRRLRVGPERGGARRARRRRRGAAAARQARGRRAASGTASRSSAGRGA